jgi:hypothetical protein
MLRERFGGLSGFYMNGYLLCDGKLYKKQVH